MSWNNTPFTRRLGIRYPIVQGPFGGGFSTVELTSVVSNGGGLGSYGAHLLAPAEIVKLAGQLRDATTQPFALNLWISRHDPGAEQLEASDAARALARMAALHERLGIPLPALPAQEEFTLADQMEAILEARPAVFSFVFGIPDAAMLQACRQRGIVTLGAATTAAEAVALESAGVDMVVATGCGAGGHRPSFLRPAEDSLVSTMTLLPHVVQAVRIPVVAAGGIADANGIAAALAQGAQAVQIGTAFLACEESGTSQAHREALLAAGASHATQLTTLMTGRLARFMPNALLKELENHGSAPLPFPWQGWLNSELKRHAMQANETDYFPGFYSGEAAALVSHRHAGALLKALVKNLS
jgi:nitronate monooxygenase